MGTFWDKENGVMRASLAEIGSRVFMLGPMSLHLAHAQLPGGRRRSPVGFSAGPSELSRIYISKTNG